MKELNEFEPSARWIVNQYTPHIKRGTNPETGMSLYYIEYDVHGQLKTVASSLHQAYMDGYNAGIIALANN